MRQDIIFGTPYWVTKLELTNSELSALKEKALESESVNSGGNSARRSNHGDSHHTELNFLGAFSTNLPGAAAVTRAFRSASIQYGYNVTEASFAYWSIVSRKYSFNTRHDHGSALLSGVLYISTPEQSGALRLCDPRPAKRILNTDHNKLLGEVMDLRHHDVEIQPVEGVLVVFPGWLEHEVTMTLADEPRIIYSFNMTAIK